MSQFALDRPLASWEDQTTTAATSWDDLKDPSVQLKPGGVGLGNLHRKGTNYKPLSEPAAVENTKRNVLQTNAFKSAIAALGPTQPRIPTRDRQKEYIAKGTGWDTNPLLKTPFWTDNNHNAATTKQQQQQQQFQKPQQSPQPQQDNVLAVFDISFVDDSDTGISIKQNHTFRSMEMIPEKSNDSSISSVQLAPTTTTSISSYTTSSLVSANVIPGSNAFIWDSSPSEKQQQEEGDDDQNGEKEQQTKKTNTTKWNPKAQAFQFNLTLPSTPFINDEGDGFDKQPITPIFEFAKPSEEPEAPFFNFTSRNKQSNEVPLFDFSTALNPEKVKSFSIPSSTGNNDDEEEDKCEDEYKQEEEEEEEEDVVPSSTINTSEFTFSVPATKKVTITSPHPKKPNPEALEFTPTISKAILIKSPTASSTVSIKSNTTTATWNPKVTEFVPTPNNNSNDDDDEDVNISSFVVRPKSTKIEIKAPSSPTTTTDKQEPESENNQDSDLQSQTQPETTRGLEEPIPILQITISFAPGVTSILSVFENDDPKKVVASFCRKHGLEMTNKAQLSFVDTITKLKNAKLNSLSKPLINK